MSGMQKTEVDSIYCLKALCAFFVVIIHSAMWGREEVFFLLKIAVPCFFAISGYFLFADDVSKECAKAWKWIKKTLLLYAFFCVAYALFNHFLHGATYSWRSLCLCIGTGAVPSVHLWYLNSMWQGLVLFVFLRRCHCLHPIAVLLMLLVGSAFSAWGLSYCCPHSPLWRYGNPLWALSLMSGGYYAGKYQLSRGRTTLFVAGLIVCLGIESFIPHPAGFFQMLISRCCYLFASVCALVLCVKYSGCSIPWMAWIGKYHSANIYYYHIMVRSLLLLFSARLVGVDMQHVSPPLTFALTLLLSVLLVWLQGLGRKVRHDGCLLMERFVSHRRMKSRRR